MPIFEEGSNFPMALGRKNMPPVIIRAQKMFSSIPLGQQAMALIRGESPIHLAQLSRQHDSSRLPPFNTPGLASTLLSQVFKQGAARKKLREMFPRLSGQNLAAERNIPRPYVRPDQWASRLGEIPSVESIVGGPARTVLPQKYNMSVII
jgi:hypothetical protein